MRNFIDLGMSDPLTLGLGRGTVSHMSERIENLANRRPVTKASRAMAAVVLLGLAGLSAPYTIASDQTDKTERATMSFSFSDGARWDGDRLISGKAFKIEDSDGELRAYRISEGGTVREEVEIEKIDDDSYRLTLEDGEVVTFDKPDLSGLAALEGLRGLDALDALDGLSGLSKLSRLSDLSELAKMKTFRIATAEKAFGLPDGSFAFEGVPEDMRGLIEELVESGEGVSSLKVERHDDGERMFVIRKKNGEIAHLPDSVVKGEVRFDFTADPLARAAGQIDQMERQLEALKDDEALAYDLDNALRDLQNARRSLEAAEARRDAAE